MTTEKIKIEKNFIFLCESGISIKLGDFPVLYQCFLDNMDSVLVKSENTTLSVEDKGKEVMKKGFSDREAAKDGVYDFYNMVMNWGGVTGDRVRGVIASRHKPAGEKDEEKIEQAIKVAVVGAICSAGEKLLKIKRQKAVGEEKNEIMKDAIRKIVSPKASNNAAKKDKWIVPPCGLEGLGLSYGSKILRMLLPEKMAAYDEILQNSLGYPKNDVGYAQFCGDCEKIADRLNGKGGKSKTIINTARQKEKKGEKWLVADVEAVLFLACYSQKRGKMIWLNEAARKEAVYWKYKNSAGEDGTRDYVIKK